MNQATANQLAAIVGGEPWMSGGNIWLVTVTRQDGAIVVFGDGSICEYADDDAFERGKAMSSIDIEILDADDLYVISDMKGGIIYNDPAMKRGWRYQEDADHEVDAMVSRGMGTFAVVRQGDLES